MSALLVVHVCAAAVGLISGAMSMLLRKGAGRHRIAGNVFFGSMLVMTSTATVLAIRKPSPFSLIVGLLTFYLVTTAWVAARRREGGAGLFDVAALLLAMGCGVAGFVFGFQPPEPISAEWYFLFGSVALSFAASDVCTYLRGGVSGAQRIRRHLWRMGLALVIAFVSVYPGPGRARLFPSAWPATNLLLTPVIVFGGMTIFWMVRMSARRARTI